MLFFSTDRFGGVWEIVVATRGNPDDPTAAFDQLHRLPNLNTPQNDLMGCIAYDENGDPRELFFSSHNYPGGRGGFDIYVAEFLDPENPLAGVAGFRNLGSPINTWVDEWAPSISPDGLRLFFSDRLVAFDSSPRPGGHGQADLWMATRASWDAPWCAPENIPAPPNSAAEEVLPWMSYDGKKMLFASYPTGCCRFMNLWEVEVRAPVPEFRRGDANADGATDIADGIFALGHLFLGGAEPSCLDAADTDDSGALDISDAVLVFNFLFLGGPPPAEPFEDCGADSTDDELDCTAFPCD
jgi:hypothetical protein